MRTWPDVSTGRRTRPSFWTTLQDAVDEIEGGEVALPLAGIEGALEEHGHIQRTYYTSDYPSAEAAIAAAQSAGGGTVVVTEASTFSETVVLTTPNLTLKGLGKNGPRLTGPPGETMFEMDGADYLTVESLGLRASGHMFDVVGTSAHCRWRDLLVVQDSTSHSILYVNDTLPGRSPNDYIDNQWDDIESWHSESASVPTFYVYCYAPNRNKWSNFWATYSGNYWVWIETTHAASYAYDNTIENVTGEVLTGGAVMILGGIGTRLVDIGIYDLFNDTTKDLFVLDKATYGGGTLYSKESVLNNVRRTGFSLGSGLYDLRMGGGGGNHPTTLINCGGSTAFTVKDKSPLLTVIEGNVTFLDGSYAAIMKNGVFTPARTATADRIAASYVGPGAMMYDTTLGIPIWSNGTVWKDAAGTTV